MMEEKTLREELLDIVTMTGKYEPTPAELERWTEETRNEYIIDRLISLLHSHRTTILDEVKGRVEGMKAPVRKYDKYSITIDPTKSDYNKCWYNKALYDVLTTIEEMKGKE